MPHVWQVLTATDYEEQQILVAGTGGTPDVAANYYAGISLTQPTKLGAITELAGNNYARVLIAAWGGAGFDFTGFVTDADYPSPYFSVVAAGPLADVVFPAPAAGSWWSSGAAVYLFLADAVSGGHVRWWMAISPATAPTPTSPFILRVGDLLIGVARQDAGEIGAAVTVGVLALKFWAKAIDRLTKHDPTYSPTFYLGAGYGDFYDSDGNPLGGHEPDVPILTGGNAATAGFDYAGGTLTTFSSTVKDADYARKSIAWSAPAADADGWYVANSADIVWTLGDNTVTAGDPIPPEPILRQQLAWNAHVFGLGFGPTVIWRGGRGGGHAFALWQRGSGGHGGLPPSTVSGSPGTPVSGLVDDGGEIWGYPYLPSVTVPAQVPRARVVHYFYVEESEIIGVFPGSGGLPSDVEVQAPTYPDPPYHVYEFFVLYEEQGDGSWRDPVSGSTLDETTLGTVFAAWGTVFPPDATHGGYGWVVNGGIEYRVTDDATYSETNTAGAGMFVIGDQVKVPAGALKIRLR